MGRSAGRLVALLASGVLVGSLGLVTTDVAAEATPENDSGSALDSLLGSGAVVRTGPDALTVDISDPDVSEMLMTAGPALDGWTVQVEGIDVLESEQRANADIAAFEADIAEGLATRQPSPSLQCPPAPDGSRVSGATRPYLGCDPATGEERWGTLIHGSVPDSLQAAAVVAVQEQTGSDAAVSASVIELGLGQYLVDFPTSFADLMIEVGSGVGMRVDSALLFTAYSNDAVRSVQFAVDGSCMAYAVAVGGDACSVVTVEEGMR